MCSVHFSGSKALLLRFEQEISPQINAYVLSTEQRIQKALKEGEIYGIDELVSTYASLLIYFNPCVLSLNSLLDILEKIKMLWFSHFIFPKFLFTFFGNKFFSL